MIKIKALTGLLWVPVALAAAACQYPDPYVYAPREFDRSAAEFRQIPLDRSSVTICASPFSGVDERITALADQECRRVGKNAQDPLRGFGVCPMLLASVVVFRCVPPAS